MGIVILWKVYRMIKIFDNFLPKEQHKLIYNSIFQNSIFPWFITPILTDRWDHCDSKENLQFSSWIYKDFRPEGPQFDLFLPIIYHPELGIKTIKRIKANLNLQTPEIITHGFHVDDPTLKNPAHNAIYYVNSNDGYTLFEDGTKIESVENRLVIFNSLLKHTGTSCTDEKLRCVVNFLYYSDNREDYES